MGSSFMQVHLKEIRRHWISTTMVDDCNGLSNQVVKVERKPHKFMDEGDRWMQVRMFYTETATCKTDDFLQLLLFPYVGKLSFLECWLCTLYTGTLK